MEKRSVNLFDVMPCISEDIQFEKNEEGLIVIAFPRFENKFVQKYLIPKGISKFLHLTLDERGTKVWELIDGKRELREIANLLGDDFKNEKDFKHRLEKFIVQLYKRGFLKLNIYSDKLEKE